MTNRNDNFIFLQEYITAKIVDWIASEKKLELNEAMRIFFNSETFEALSNPDTGMYIESPGYIYGILQEELRRGTIHGITE